MDPMISQPDHYRRCCISQTATTTTRTLQSLFHTNLRHGASTSLDTVKRQSRINTIARERYFDLVVYTFFIHD